MRMRLSCTGSAKKSDSVKPPGDGFQARGQGPHLPHSGASGCRRMEGSWEEGGRRERACMLLVSATQHRACPCATGHHFVCIPLNGARREGSTSFTKLTTTRLSALFQVALRCASKPELPYHATRLKGGQRRQKERGTQSMRTTQGRAAPRTRSLWHER
jgi:hypothetical protein